MTTRTHTTWGARLVGVLAGSLVLLSLMAATPASADPAADKRAEARRIADQLDALGQTVSVRAEAVDAGRLKAEDLTAEAAVAERDLAKAEAEASGAKSRLAAEAVDTYVQGGVDLGAGPMLASDGDPMRRRQYAMSLQAKKADLLDAAKAQAAIVREKRDALQRARQQAQGAVADVERAQRDAEAAAAKLEAIQGRVDGELATLVDEEQTARAESEAVDVQKGLAARNPTSPVAALVAQPRTTPAAPGVVGRPAPPAPVVVTVTVPPIPGAPPTTRPPAPKPPTPPTSSGAAAAVAEAARQIGKPYRWAGAGPDNFDCSGLTAWAWKAGGRILPHSSAAQFGSLPRVNPADARPGDLFAFGSPIHHIGIYIGGGQMIAAPQTGKNVQYQAAYRKDLTGVVRP
ncbi:MAG: C40 family peptidase [Acidimicrobiales bacterium]